MRKLWPFEVLEKIGKMMTGLPRGITARMTRGIVWMITWNYMKHDMWTIWMFTWTV